jgi:hypothetical protein
VTTIVVERITAFVAPDPDAAGELDLARRRAAAGDSSWAEWVGDVAAGRALIARLEIEVTLAIGDAIRRTRLEAPGVWLELDAHPPAVECQVQEAAGVALAELADLRLPATRMSSMCVHVELDHAIRERLPAPHA